MLVSRDVQQRSDWMVRLDSYQSTEQHPVTYEHPFSWKAEDLSAILARLFLEERVGLMDHAQPAKPVFSPAEIALIEPVVREAFEKALPAEWIAFLLLQPNAGETGVTSGALFVESHRLHIVVANHHTIIGNNSEELARVRANPFYSIKGSGGVLGFEPSRFSIATKVNWSGGHRASASELVLDHTAFLSYLTHAASRETPLRIVPPSTKQTSAEGQTSTEGVPDQGAFHAQPTLRQLQGEIERLKQQLVEKDLEIDRLKAELVQAGHRP
ncbi:MAG: hypothetical protein LZF60_160188 [Nitrospira sp.]|nr:hypothetical protein [Nitrospira sp.]ULA59858.1 MAG: hypothetical protein LZF60_160188 [Nitrospira sp.]